MVKIISVTNKIYNFYRTILYSSIYYLCRLIQLLIYTTAINHSYNSNVGDKWSLELDQVVLKQLCTASHSSPPPKRGRD